MSTQGNRQIVFKIICEILLPATSMAAFMYLWITFSQPIVEKILQQALEFPIKGIFMLILLFIAGIFLSISAGNITLALLGLGKGNQQPSEER